MRCKTGQGYAHGRAVDNGGLAMRAICFRFVTAVVTALLLVLLAAPASADPGVPHNGGYVGGGATTSAEPGDGGVPGP